MNDKGLVADVYDAADAVARMEGSAGARIVLHCAMVITMLNVLPEKKGFKLKVRAWDI